MRLDQLQFYADMKITEAKWDTAGKGVFPPGDAYMINFCANVWKLGDLAAKLKELDQGGKERRYLQFGCTGQHR